MKRKRDLSAAILRSHPTLKPMGKEKEGMIRFRVIFDDHRLLNNSQLSDGLGRCWLLLKPNLVTFADLASHLRHKFALRNPLILFIDDFVLPPFESTRILKDKDIIRVKLKNVKLKDALLHCDGQNIVQDPQIARAHGLSFNNNAMADEKSQANLQGNGNIENDVHDSNLSLGIGVLEQKREHSLELHNSMKQSEGINNALESEPHIAFDVTKEYVQSSAATSKNDQNQCTGMTYKGRNYYSDVHKKEYSGLCMENHAWIDRKPEGHSSDNKTKIAEHKIDFATLFPLTRSPLKGDVLAYRYVVPSSTVYPMLSSPQVGKVSAFDYKSSEIVLVPASEFEVFSEENPKIPISQRGVSPYKEDGSLEIKLSALIDVRLLKAHNSEESTCFPEGTFNRNKKDEWEVALAKSNWNQSDARHTGRANGAKYASNERMASTSWFYGTSPAAALFWETVLSKGTFGRGAN